MTVRAGEEIHNSGDFRCRRCGELVHVDEGLTLPKCPVAATIPSVGGTDRHLKDFEERGRWQL